MGAVAAPTRGPIEEVTHIRYGMTPEASKAERLASMGQVLEELEPVLAQPVYEGDVETALIHNMGRAAFGYGGGGSDNVRDYIRFSAAIDADTTEDPTPVLLVSQIQRGKGRDHNTETALVMVDSEATFRSSMSHERDVQKRGYADEIAITRRSLSLVGDTSTIHADISGYGHDVREIHPYADQDTGQTELVLNDRSIVDGTNGSKPISADHDGFTQDTDRMWAGPTYLVGWEAIGSALGAMIYDRATHHHDRDHKPQGVFPYTLKLRGFLERTGQLEALLEHNAPLKKMFEQAVRLDKSVAALAPAGDHED